MTRIQLLLQASRRRSFLRMGNSFKVQKHALDADESQRLKWLRASTLMPFFSDSELEKLVLCFDVRRLRKGEHLATSSPSFYVIAHGDISVQTDAEITPPHFVYAEDVSISGSIRPGHLCHKAPGAILLYPESQELSIQTKLYADSDAFLLVLSYAKLHSLASIPHSGLGANLEESMLRIAQCNCILALHQVPFFRKVSAQDLALLIDMCDIVSYGEKHVVFLEGDPGRCMYVVLVGQVKVTTSTSPGRILATFSRGGYFGEMALTFQFPRAATVVCKQTSLVLKISDFVFHRFLKHCPQVAGPLENAMKHRIIDQMISSNIPFFSGVPKSKMLQLSNYCQIENQITAGTVIIKQGEPGDKFYVIVHGQVQICTSSQTVVADGSIEANAEVKARQHKLRYSDGDQLTSLSTKAVQMTAAATRKRLESFHNVLKTMSSATAPASIVPGNIGDTRLGRRRTTIFPVITRSIVAEREICRLSRGAYFGELALVTNEERSASVIATTDCLLLSIARRQFQQFFQECPAFHAEINLRLLKGRCELHHILQHPDACGSFHAFLQEEDAEETILFVESVQRYRERFEGSSEQQIHNMALAIFDEFISKTSFRPIDISPDRSKAIKHKLQMKIGKLTAALFDEAEVEILKQIQLLHFKNFKQSSAFDLLLNKLLPYQ